MSADKPMTCPDCERAFDDAGDGVLLDDDLWRCHDCAENEIALAKLERRQQRLDDPRHNQGDR